MSLFLHIFPLLFRRPPQDKALLPVQVPGEKRTSSNLEIQTYYLQMWISSAGLSGCEPLGVHWLCPKSMKTCHISLVYYRRDRSQCCAAKVVTYTTKMATVDEEHPTLHQTPKSKYCLLRPDNVNQCPIVYRKFSEPTSFEMWVWFSRIHLLKLDL